MNIVKKQISLNDLKKIARKNFGNLVKAVVDVKQGVMAIGGDLHADEEALLLKKGSFQKNLWGINLYPDIKSKNWLEFDSMINLRPFDNNQSRGVDSPEIRKKIVKIVNQLVKK